MALEIIDTMRNQYCVYWPPAGLDVQGDPQYGEAVELRVRWEDVNEVFTNPRGQQLVSKSKVYTGEDVQIDGVLWIGPEGRAGIEGALTELTSTTAPFDNSGAAEIQRFDNIPDINAEDFLKIAWL